MGWSASGSLRRVAPVAAVNHVIVEILAACALAYQALAILACVLFRASRTTHPTPLPASVLKPVHGVDAALRTAIASHTALDGQYELLCGVREGYPAAEVIAEFPT